MTSSIHVAWSRIFFWLSGPGAGRDRPVQLRPRLWAPGRAARQL